jgi:hypothetical protein
LYLLQDRQQCPGGIDEIADNRQQLFLKHLHSGIALGLRFLTVSDCPVLLFNYLVDSRFEPYPAGYRGRDDEAEYTEIDEIQRVESGI